MATIDLRVGDEVLIDPEVVKKLIYSAINQEAWLKPVTIIDIEPEEALGKLGSRLRGTICVRNAQLADFYLRPEEICQVVKKMEPPANQPQVGEIVHLTSEAIEKLTPLFNIDKEIWSGPLSIIEYYPWSSYKYIVKDDCQCGCGGRRLPVKPEEIIRIQSERNCQCEIKVLMSRGCQCGIKE